MKQELRKGCLSVLLAIGLLSELTAQRVRTDHPYASGCPVIDLTDLNPIGAVLTADDAYTRRTLINSATPDDNATIGIADNHTREEWNLRMSPMFQVMKSNLRSALLSWANAYNACKTYNGTNGANKDTPASTSGQWRLPTQRELQMIYVLHPQLKAKGFAFDSDDYYVGCTEAYFHSTWNLRFTTGYMAFISKSRGGMVRCVRDL